LEAYRSRIKIADSSVETLSAQLNAAHAERDKLHEDITAWLDEMAKQKESQKQEMAQRIESLAVGRDAVIGKVGEEGEEECDSTIMQKDGGESDVVPHTANISSERPGITEEEDDTTEINVATTDKEQAMLKEESPTEGGENEEEDEFNWIGDVVPHMANIPTERPPTTEDDDATEINVATSAKQALPKEEGPTVKSYAEATAKPAESSSSDKVSDEAVMTKDLITTAAETTPVVSPKKKKKKKKKKKRP